MKKRVLLVSPVGFPGGAELVILQLAKYLPQWNIDPILACLRPGPLANLAQQQQTEHYVFERDYRYRQIPTVGAGAVWLAQIVRKLSIDLIHSNFTAHFISGSVAHLMRIPEVWHLYDYPHHRDVLDRLVERIPTRYVIFATEKVKSGYPQLRRLPHSVVYPLCIEPKRLQAIASSKDIRQRYQLPQGPLLLNVARLQKHKGHRFLLEALPKIIAFHPNILCVIVGGASGQEQETYRYELMEQCKSLGISKHVKFLGYVNETDLVTLYREAAVLVHPSLSEGFGLTLLEAMALGTPVIAAETDGPKEIIQSGANGLLIPTGDSSALSCSVIRLLKDEQLCQSLRRDGLKFVQNFEVTQMVRQCVRIYSTLLGVSLSTNNRCI